MGRLLLRKGGRCSKKRLLNFFLWDDILSLLRLGKISLSPGLRGIPSLK